jgi:hypothetical protein
MPAARRPQAYAQALAALEQPQELLMEELETYGVLRYNLCCILSPFQVGPDPASRFLAPLPGAPLAGLRRRRASVRPRPAARARVPRRAGAWVKRPGARLRSGRARAQCAMLCAASFPRIVPTCHIADNLAVLEGETSMIP